MAWPKAMPIVEVEWVDSSSVHGWTDVESHEQHIKDTSVLPCTSAGYLFHKDAQRVALLQSQSGSGQVMELLDIPRAAVKSITILQKARRKK